MLSGVPGPRLLLAERPDVGKRLPGSGTFITTMGGSLCLELAVQPCHLPGEAYVFLCC